MTKIGETHGGYRVFAIPCNTASPMDNHQYGHIAVDDERRLMFAHGAFVRTYGTESIMHACNKYRED